MWGFSREGQPSRIWSCQNAQNLSFCNIVHIRFQPLFFLYIHFTSTDQPARFAATELPCQNLLARLTWGNSTFGSWLKTRLTVVTILYSYLCAQFLAGSTIPLSMRKALAVVEHLLQCFHFVLSFMDVLLDCCISIGFCSDRMNL